MVEAKRVGQTLTGVEIQSEKYGAGLPAGIPAPVRPLPFLYQSTGVETRFTNRLDPVPKSRELFAFHRPETLAAWAASEPLWLPVVGGAPNPRSACAQLVQHLDEHIRDAVRLDGELRHGVEHRAARCDLAAVGERADRLGGLGGALGGFGRKKQEESKPADQAAPVALQSVVLMEQVTELSGLSATVDASKFAVPAGFKQVEHEMKKLVKQ